jgi:hypothetical protein
VLDKLPVFSRTKELGNGAMWADAGVGVGGRFSADYYADVLSDFGVVISAAPPRLC